MGATVLTPVTIVNDADLDFGNIAYTTTGGTVVLSPEASATCTTTLVHTGNCRAATFEGNAGFFSILRVKRPNGGSITLSGPSGATMSVDDFTFGAGPWMQDMGQTGANHRFRIWNLFGDYTFYVGGTLHVAGNQTPGVYTGTFDIQIAYN